MNKTMISRLIKFTLLVLCVFGRVNMPVSAEEMNKNNNLLIVQITLERQDYIINLNERLVLKGNIKDIYGRPVGNKNIAFEIDSKYAGQAKSDENGDFEWTSDKNPTAGTYEILAYSKETRSLDSATARTRMTVLPAKVLIQTVPVIAGVTFELNGERFTSDEYGYASTLVYEAGDYRLDVLDGLYENPYQRITFDRWLEEAFEPYRDISVPAKGTIQAGFEVYQLVGQSFVDQNGTAFDTQRIESFSIRSDQGDFFTLTDGTPKWVPSSRVTRRITGLEETKVLYSLQDVIVDGSNVVNISQQKFYSSPNGNWTISLLLYSLEISASDALFGKSIGESVNIEFPDGKVENFPLDQNGSVKIDLLARGTYYLEMVYDKGLKYKTPVALSRNQEVNMKIISYLDLTVVGIVGLAVAVGLLLFGRPWLVIPGHAKKKLVLEARMPEPVSMVSKRLSQLKEPKAGLAKISASKISPPNKTVFTTPTRLKSSEVRFSQPVIQTKVSEIPMYYRNVKLLNNEKFLNFVGCDREAFTSMLRALDNGSKKVGRPTKLSSADQLLAMIYVKKAVWDKTELAGFYKISETTLDRYILKTEDALKASKRFELLELAFKNNHQSNYDWRKNQKIYGQKYRATYDK